MKFVTIAFIIFFFCCSFINSMELNCKFTNENNIILGSVYCCKSNQINRSIPDRSNPKIDSITGIHQKSKRNQDVKAVEISNSHILNFPSGLERKFNNLEGISIFYSELKKVGQQDLRPFPNLRFLHLYGNALQIIEKDLFQFNPQLEYISLANNEISKIDSNVFNIFTNKLSSLELNDNTCKFYGPASTKEEVNELIREVQKGICLDILPVTTTTPRPTTTTRRTTTTTPIPFHETDEFREALENVKKNTQEELRIEFEEKEYNLIKKLKNQKEQLDRFKAEFDSKVNSLTNQLEDEKKMCENLEVKLMKAMKDQKTELMGMIEVDGKKITDKLEAQQKKMAEDLDKKSNHEIKRVEDKMVKEVEELNQKISRCNGECKSTDIAPISSNSTSLECLDIRVKFIEKQMGVEPEHNVNCTSNAEEK